jgi:diaminohydroxyphosphoribosylaminopyrimidine deaminase/5-amino-6-(5-phosphoribosylamino)uracil reductase
MNRAIALARRAEGQTSPNPMVGAVVVADGEIVGEGYHRKAGRAHAEIEALEAAGGRAKGATVYVSLEPCCVQGRTPPCTDALIQAGVASLAYAVRDPNPKVNGQGHRQLEEAGIDVRPGVCREEGVRLIQAFSKMTREGLPWVTAKFAMSLDGKIATRTGHSRWISSEESRRFSHELRQISDVIAVGAGTVTLDNPRLTTRLDISNPSHPLRVVVDSRGRAPIESEIFSSSLPGQTVLATTQRVDSGYVKQLESQGVEVWKLSTDLNGRVDLVAMLRKIVDEEMLTVLVEGGSGLLGSFFERDLVDRAMVSVAPKIIGGVDAPSPVGGLGIPVMGDALLFGEMDVEARGVDLWIRAEKPAREAQSRSPVEKSDRAEMSSED